MSNVPPSIPPIPPSGGVYHNPGLLPPSRGVSGLAISGFVISLFSLILCLPVLVQGVAGLALILALIGIFVTGPGKKSGRGFAIAGVIISVLGIIVWTTIQVQLYRNYALPSIELVKFAERVAKGDPQGATAFTAPPYDNAKIPGLIADVKSFGKYITIVQDGKGTVPITFEERDGKRVFIFKSKLTFENMNADAHVELTKIDSNTWKITRFDLIPLSPAMPATLPSPALP